ncbi:MAG: hypothetical protein ABI811_13575 [Acidobacteriota bacterium]
MAAIVWKGFLSFGLVTFPIRLFTAARAEHVSFHLLHRKDLSEMDALKKSLAASSALRGQVRGAASKAKRARAA